MQEAKKEDSVKVNYTGKLADGTVFDSSANREPLQFKLGAGEVIPGFEEAIIGMQEGTKKTVNISSDQAYGPYQDDLVIEVSKNKLPDNLKLELGQKLTMKMNDNSQIMVTVTDIRDEAISIDANHPLAGKDLTFDIELIGINP